LRESERILSEFLRRYPKAAYVRFVRSKVLLALGRPQEALEDLRRAGSDGLDDAAFLESLGALLPEGVEREKAKQKALNAHQRQVALTPEG
jgi:predicted Zn-dependent protease